jgi:hypothetical protein
VWYLPTELWHAPTEPLIHSGTIRTEPNDMNAAFMLLQDPVV